MALKKRVIRKRKPFRRRGPFFVYILECSDGSFYTGYTNDLSNRVALHNKGGGSKYVRTRLPAELVYFKKYQYYKLAILEERRIKSLSRKQKEKLITAGRQKSQGQKVKRTKGQKVKMSRTVTIRSKGF